MNHKEWLVSTEEELNAQQCIENRKSSNDTRIHQYRNALKKELTLLDGEDTTFYQDICEYIRRIENPSFIKQNINRDRKNNEVEDSDIDGPKFYLYAYIDKNTWSNIRLFKKENKGSPSKLHTKKISKETGLKLVIALQMTEEEADSLLKKAFLALTSLDYRDRVIIALLRIKCYDPDEASEILDWFGKDKKHPFDNIYKGVVFHNQ